MTDLRAQLQSTLGDAYTLERELGGGGMSRVFVAHENALGRTVVAAALEQLGDHADALAMIERAVKQPDSWLNMYNRAERYDALRRDPRADAIMASIER